MFVDVFDGFLLTPHTVESSKYDWDKHIFKESVLLCIDDFAERFTVWRRGLYRRYRNMNPETWFILAIAYLSALNALKNTPVLV